MTETLFERYKEALRAGHVAATRGRLEDAAAAYREAIAVAGDRAVPRIALGGVLLRAGDPEAGLAEYEAALGISADDDTALLGRAQALVVLRRTAEAALTYDRLAHVREAAGNVAEAAEAARRALAIEPTDLRRERHGGLAEKRRAASGEPAPGEGGDRPGIPGEDVVPADPEALAAEVEAAIAVGDAAGAAAAALEAARAYRAAGHAAAAFDACLQGIAERPADVDLHLLLADLAAERGWQVQAADARRRLLRLVELDGDAAAAEVVRAAVAAAGQDGEPATA